MGQSTVPVAADAAGREGCPNDHLVVPCCLSVRPMLEQDSGTNLSCVIRPSARLLRRRKSRVGSRLIVSAVALLSASLQLPNSMAAPINQAPPAVAVAPPAGVAPQPVRERIAYEQSPG